MLQSTGSALDLSVQFARWLLVKTFMERIGEGAFTDQISADVKRY